MHRLTGPFFSCALALANTQANAQAGATPPSASQQELQPTGGDQQAASKPSIVDEVCSTLEHAAAENELPVDFFVRVIWQESRFNALAVSSKGAQGIAQFMPGTAEWRGLNNPFDVIAALKASASYLGDLRNRYGNLGLAAAAYNAGPQRVQDWLLARSSLPKETRHYVQIVSGYSAEEWSGGNANLALPTPVPCKDAAKSMNSRTAV
jgi:soluble lytic murein transglycosylase-like protein